MFRKSKVISGNNVCSTYYSFTVNYGKTHIESRSLKFTKIFKIKMIQALKFVCSMFLIFNDR